MRASRFTVVFALSASLLTACHRRAAACGRCGMAIDPGDLHTTEIVFANGEKTPYDSVVCAVYEWHHPIGAATPTKMIVHEYYTKDARDSADVLFVEGSNVTGPMGSDLVAVDPANVKKFEADHGGKDLRFSDLKPGTPQEQTP